MVGQTCLSYAVPWETGLVQCMLEQYKVGWGRWGGAGPGGPGENRTAQGWVE